MAKLNSNHFDVIAYGMDPGLNHGAIVQSLFRFTPDTLDTPELIHWEVVFEWTKKDPYHLTSTSAEFEVARLYNAIFGTLGKRPTATWGIERDITAGYWGTAQQDGILNFFLGYMYRGLQMVGCPVIWLSPSKVRGKVKAKRVSKSGKETSGAKNASKQEVWRQVAGVVKGMFDILNLEEDPLGDIRDAFVLSFLAAQGAATLELAQQQVQKQKES